MTNNYPYRPLYETAKDLKHEKEIAKKIEDALSWRLHKLSKAYFLDFIAFSKYPFHAQPLGNQKASGQNHFAFFDPIG